MIVQVKSAKKKIFIFWLKKLALFFNNVIFFVYFFKGYQIWLSRQRFKNGNAVSDLIWAIKLGFIIEKLFGLFA
jgi:hypothetical protein